MEISVDITKYDREELKKLNSISKPSLFQTVEWANLQESLPDRKIGAIAVIKENNEITGYFMIIVHNLPANQKYAYINRGPVFINNGSNDGNKSDKSDKNDSGNKTDAGNKSDADKHNYVFSDATTGNIVINKIKEWCKQEKCLFFRIAPNIRFPYKENIDEEENSNDKVAEFEQNKSDKQQIELGKIMSVLKKNGGKRSPSQHQPEFTSIIDISTNPEEILVKMKPKGRYNIKVAKKHEIEIKKSTDIDSFYDLVLTTTSRNKFSGNNKEYYRKFLEKLDTKARMYLAYYKNTPVAGIIVTYEENNLATYYYGASDNKYRKYMAPYLIHWKAIEDAKAEGYDSYDLFGIAPPNSDNHPWQGITSFKMKFGGEIFQYPATYDFPINKALYHLFMLANSIKKSLRR